MSEINKKHPLYQEDLHNILKTEGIEALRDKSFLITGATGLIGTQLIDALMLLGNAIIYAVGRSKEKAQSRLGEYYDNPLFHFIEQDVTEPFSPDIHVDFILPLASNTHPLAYSKYPIETMYINLKGAEHALELARRCGAIVLYPSTVEVYGNARGTDVFTEDYTGLLNLSNSRACYTESKRANEALCQSYIAENGVIVKIVRLSRVFGPSVKTTDTKASSQFIQNAVNGEDIVLKSEGKQYYSYTYVADVISAMLFVLLHGKAGVPYNISNKDCDVHLKDFAQACADYAGTKVIFDLPSDIERKGYSVALTAIMDNSRLLDLGWNPQYAFEKAIERTIRIISNK